MSLRARLSSISARLTLMNLFVSAIALILALVAFLALDIVSYRQSLVQSLQTQAQILGDNTASSILFEDPETAQNTLAALRRSRSVVSAVLITPAGKPFATYRRNPSDPAPNTPAWSSTDPTYTWTLGQRILLAQRIPLDRGQSATLYILSETTVIWQRLRLYGLIFAGILLLCLVLALIVTSRFRRVIAEPLGNLSETARVVTAARDYSLRAAVPAVHDELAELVVSFNDMLHEIEQRDAALQQSREALETRVRERTAELSSANRELEAFSYSVAHDLRGPLEAIGNIAYLLQTSSGDELHGEARRNLDLLPRAIDRMSTLITDLLNLSRARRAELFREPVDLSEIAATIEADLRKQEPERLVLIHIAPGLKVIADKGLMYIVMYNLFSNAWKYTSRTEFAEISFGFRSDRNGRVFCITDNGAGFDPQFSDRLFRPFERLHTQDEFPGTGIGLATVQRIVERHGGRIWAESTPGQGATFFFTVPHQ